MSQTRGDQRKWLSMKMVNSVRCTIILSNLFLKGSLFQAPVKISSVRSLSCLERNLVFAI